MEILGIPLHLWKGDGSCVYIQSSFKKKKKQQQPEKTKQNSSTAPSEEEQILIKGCVSVFPTSFVNTNSALDFKGTRTLHY